MISLFFTLILTTLASAIEIEFDTLKSNFKQSVTSIEGSKIEYNGEIYIKLPTDILWIYKNPIEKRVLVDSKKIISYEPLLEQATIISIDETPSLVDILKSAKKSENDSFKAVVDGVEYTVELDKNSLPKRVFYSDKLKNSIVIEFINTQKDVEFDSDTFEPNLPAGTDIIR